MRCANGHPLPGGATVCGVCGAPGVRVCAQGHPLPPGFRLCSACGSLEASPVTEVAAPARTEAPSVGFLLACAAPVLLAAVFVAALALWPRSTPAVSAAPPTTTRPAPTTATTSPTSSAPSTRAPSRRGTGGSGTAVDPERFKELLVEQGLDPDQADCIIDGLVQKGVPLEDLGNPTPAQERAVADVALRCASGG